VKGLHEVGSRQAGRFHRPVSDPYADTANPRHFFQARPLPTLYPHRQPFPAPRREKCYTVRHGRGCRRSVPLEQFAAECSNRFTESPIFPAFLSLPRYTGPRIALAPSTILPPGICHRVSFFCFLLQVSRSGVPQRKVEKGKGVGSNPVRHNYCYFGESFCSCDASNFGARYPFRPSCV
jgi:hypothetical protein